MHGSVFAQPLQIDGAVLIIKKHILAAVAALGDMMGHMGDDCSGGAWHGLAVAYAIGKS
jgi:hypothetical protein